MSDRESESSRVDSMRLEFPSRVADQTRLADALITLVPWASSEHRRKRNRQLVTVIGFAALLPFAFSGFVSVSRTLSLGRNPLVSNVGLQMGLALAGLVIIWAIFDRSVKREFRHQMSNMIADVDPMLSEGNVRIWVDRRGMTTRHLLVSMRFSWRALVAARLAYGYVLVVFANKQIIPIPVSAFSSPKDAERFVQICYDHAKRCEGGFQERIAGHHRTTTRVCSNCGYPIDGTGSACPECGAIRIVPLSD